VLLNKGVEDGMQIKDDVIAEDGCQMNERGPARGESDKDMNRQETNKKDSGREERLTV